MLRTEAQCRAICRDRAHRMRAQPSLNWSNPSAAAAAAAERNAGHGHDYHASAFPAHAHSLVASHRRKLRQERYPVVIDWTIGGSDCGSANSLHKGPTTHPVRKQMAMLALPCMHASLLSSTMPHMRSSASWSAYVRLYQAFQARETGELASCAETLSAVAAQSRPQAVPHTCRFQASLRLLVSARVNTPGRH